MAKLFWRDPTFKREIISRYPSADGSERVVLACGHTLFCVTPRKATMCFCRACRYAGYLQWRDQVAKSSGAKVSRKVPKET